MEKKTCLLIDDDPEEKEIFGLAMSHFPEISFEFIPDSTAAFKHLSLTTICPQFIFIDMNMPVVRGKDLVARIRTLPLFSETSIYLYTTSSLQKDKTESLAAGATGYITKPDKLGALVEILQKIFKGSSW